MSLHRPAAMKKGGLIFLMLSGCVLLCHLQPDGLVRRFHVISEWKTWKQAQTYCREMFTDLATIQDAIQNTEATQPPGSKQLWIGLYYTTWKWSGEETEISSLTWFSNWASDEPTTDHNCVTMSETGFWFTKDCENHHYIMCYNAQTGEHILVMEKKSWADAQSLCRSRYTDLSSIKSQVESQQVLQVIKSRSKTLAKVSTRSGESSGGGSSGGGSSGGGSTVNTWIGLKRNMLMWSDRSNVTYSSWASDEPSDKTGCVKMVSGGLWRTSLCTENHHFLCYSDVRPLMLRTVKIRLNVGSADPNDPMMQDAILQQLDQKLKESGIKEEVKLRWRRQPDGSVFHKEKEIPAGHREEEACDSLVGKPGIR